MRCRALACLLVAFLVGGGAATACGAASAAPRRMAALAYVTGNGSRDSVWIRVLARGRARRVAAGDEPLLAPSGRSVAVSRLAASGPALLVASLAGARGGAYFDAARQTATALAWSPDSRWLAVDVLGSSGPSSGGLYVIDTRTGSISEIVAGTVCGAGFSPDRSARLVLSLSSGDCLAGPDDLYTATAGQGGATPLTTDGKSAFPVWGRQGIAYDRLTPRGQLQIWLLPRSGPATALTDVTLGALQDGLVPIAFSADGQRLLARLVGQDAVQTWTVTLPGDRVRRLSLPRHTLSPDAISADGRSVLVDEDSFETSPSSGAVISLPFGGGRSTAMAAGAAGGSWNR